MSALRRYIARIVREETELLRHEVQFNNGASIKDSTSRVETGIERLHGLNESRDDAVQLVHLVPEGAVAAVEYGGGTVKDAVEALRNGHDSSPSFVAGKPNVAGTPGRTERDRLVRTTNTERLPGS